MHDRCAIQSILSYSTHFIFDPDLSVTFSKNNLKFITALNALQGIRLTKENALQLQSDMHLFQVHDNKL